ncbi:hypothetical protein PVAP13_4KG273900 [Panicum virgatum]|uniref:Cathepsin propeptide inhibitor domain-containing protein n=1 Tax=Panicum virgatum TaxID=38727 RepID=A0A8T0TT85_PANVG|nr:hypothetical protein PVAP13_4KG273900 [Panicum virgatum]
MARVTLATTGTFVLAVALALTLAAPPAICIEFTAEDMESNDSMWALYERWSAHYEVARDAGDKLRRFRVFKETARSVYARHLGDRHYMLGLNSFADMTMDEFRDAFACKRPANGGERHFDITQQVRCG